MHPVIRVRRDEDGEIVEVLEPGETGDGVLAESVLHAEVARDPDPERLAALEAAVTQVLAEVRAVVEDWPAMRDRTLTLARELARTETPVSDEELADSEAFLGWLAQDNFTFLGYREYELSRDGEPARLTAVPDSGLGLLRGAPRSATKPLSGKSLRSRPRPAPAAAHQGQLALDRPPTGLSGLRGHQRFGPDGQVCGEWRLLGLYTTRA